MRSSGGNCRAVAGGNRCGGGMRSGGVVQGKPRSVVEVVGSEDGKKCIGFERQGEGGGRQPQKSWRRREWEGEGPYRSVILLRGSGSIDGGGAAMGVRLLVRLRGCRGVVHATRGRQEAGGRMSTPSPPSPDAMPRPAGGAGNGPTPRSGVSGAKTVIHLHSRHSVGPAAELAQTQSTTHRRRSSSRTSTVAGRHLRRWPSSSGADGEPPRTPRPHHRRRTPMPTPTPQPPSRPGSNRHTTAVTGTTPAAIPAAFPQPQPPSRTLPGPAWSSSERRSTVGQFLPAFGGGPAGRGR